MFILGLSIGVSVGLMLLWQLYLVLTAQTTIEFYNNRVDSFEARSQGRVFKNPYDLGYERNCGSVFGKGAYVASAAGTAPVMFTSFTVIPRMCLQIYIRTDCPADCGGDG